MPNMHYCRFINTVDDLKECITSIDEREPVSQEEHKARQELIAMMTNFVFDNMIDDEEDADVLAFDLPVRE